MDAASHEPAIRDLLALDYAWTTRQRQVLDLIAAERSNAEVAAALGVSLDGAKWHMREILSKLGVDTREEAAEYWRRYNGWQSRFARVFRGLLLAKLLGKAVIAAAAGVVIIAAVVFAVAQWPDGDDGHFTGTPLDPSQGAPAVLAQADAVLKRESGYTLLIEASNFELPQWGGSDAGIVRVSGDSFAVGALHRTGEANQYEIRLQDNTTYFRKTGCKDYLQIPGGTLDVLLPFMLARSSALAKARNASIKATEDDNVIVTATLDLVPGRDNPVVLKSVAATITIDRATGRVQTMTGTLPAGSFAWTFAWGGDIGASKAPITAVAQRGPGSNECP
jgi:DNA-binding CsgD family transcriptional regulator